VNFAVQKYVNNMPINTKTYSKADILQQIPPIFDEVTAAIQNTPDELFNKEIIEGKWSIAENFDHLIRGGAAVASGLKMNKMMLRAMGKPNRPSRTFEALVTRYQDKLATGAGAGLTGSFAPDKSKGYDKAEMLKNWETVKGKLAERTNKKWSEKDLDNYLMPHPLLGKLLVREVLFFTIYHNSHHLQAINRIKETV